MASDSPVTYHDIDRDQVRAALVALGLEDLYETAAWLHIESDYVTAEVVLPDKTRKPMVFKIREAAPDGP